MRIILLLFLPFLVFSQSIKVDEKTQQKLGIKLYTVKQEEVKEKLTLPATVSEYAGLVAEVYSPVSGVIKKLYVKEGDRVKKGSPLALIYSPQVADLLTQIRNAEVRLKTAEETLTREEMLYKEEVIPYARYFSAKVEYEKSKGEYKALLLSLRSFGEVVGDSVLIRSPINGYVVEQKVFLGSGVDVSKEMFKIHGHEKLWVYAYALPEDAMKVKKGTKGYVLWQNIRVPGYVDYISHEVDKNTKRVPIRLLVDNRQDLLRPGLMATVELELGKVSGFWLPAEAVANVKGKDVVFVKTPEGFSVAEVKVLRREKDKVLVEGLKTGQQVAVSGVIFLKAQAEK